MILIHFYKLCLLGLGVGFSLGLERIWFIRHCNKPKNNQNPCCSTDGYNYAQQLHTFFEDAIDPLSSTLLIIPSGFKKKVNCVENANEYNNHTIKTKADHRCQRSQRMYITGTLLYENMVSKYTFLEEEEEEEEEDEDEDEDEDNEDIGLDSRFCVGQYKELLAYVLKKRVTDAIVVWEHKEIVSMLRYLGVNVAFSHKMKKRYNHVYNLIFMLDVKKGVGIPRLSYFCVSSHEGEMKKMKKVDNCLELTRSLEIRYENGFLGMKHNKNKVEQTADLFMIVFLLCFAFLWFVVCIKCYSSVYDSFVITRLHRRDYIEIR
jgi:hypothetical protein